MSDKTLAQIARDINWRDTPGSIRALARIVAELAEKVERLEKIALENYDDCSP